jgi:hypothetical protein
MKTQRLELSASAVDSESIWIGPWSSRAPEAATSKAAPRFVHAELEPARGFLDGVVCLLQRAEHPIGDRPQRRPLLLEAFRQSVALVQRSHSSATSGHTARHANLANVTRVEGFESGMVGELLLCPGTET